MGPFLRLQNLRASVGSSSYLVQKVPALVSQKLPLCLVGRLIRCFRLMPVLWEESFLHQTFIELSMALVHWELGIKRAVSDVWPSGVQFYQRN